MQPCHPAATQPAQPGSPGCQLGDSQLRPVTGGLERAGALRHLQGAPHPAPTCPHLHSPCTAQGYATWASSAIQLDRTGQGQHAPTTVSKTAGTIRRILGFSSKVLQVSTTPGLHDFLNGDMLAAYTSFALDVRRALHAP